jgi:hypothetical protein
MVNYQLGKIYKIVCNGLTYYGSTCEPTLARRLAGHVAHYKHYKKGKGVYMRSFDIIETGEYSIILVEGFVCDTKDQLHARERYYIENNECINKYIPGRTLKEWRDTHKEYIKEQAKIYQDTHKEHRKIHRYIYKEQDKMYRDTHKEQAKIYRDTHKDCSKKFICNCGGRYTHINRLAHFKTKKHLDYITQESAMLDNSLLL